VTDINRQASGIPRRKGGHATGFFVATRL